MITYSSRWDFIRPHIQNASILDVGPAELVGTVNNEKLSRWIHHKMTLEAKRVVGLERNAEQVQALTAMGYNIVEGDAEAFHLAEQFDVVVAGELIEHLSNPGRFLDCVQTHLVRDGKLLLTTPNRYSVQSIYRTSKTGIVERYTKPIAKHVMFFDEDSITSLLTRHGFRNICIAYCEWVGLKSKSRTERLLVKFAKRYRPVLLPVLLVSAGSGPI